MNTRRDNFKRYYKERNAATNAFDESIRSILLDLVQKDIGLSLMADELNKKGLQTVSGRKWTKANVFNTLKRINQV